MGREIRKVPPNWSHPQRNEYGHFQPMHDQTFDQAVTKWKTEQDAWNRCESEDSKKYAHKYSYEDWCGACPDNLNYYRPWKDEEATWFQVWETVSEGSPVTPAFETKDQLVEYLIANGDDFQGKQYAKPWSRKAAEQFVKNEWAPSMIMQGGQFYTAETGFPEK